MSPSKCYNFARGHPNKALLPIDEVRSLFAKLATADPEDLERALNYGANAGETDVLNALADFINRHCENDDLGGFEQSAEQHLFLTLGASHGIELLTAIASKPGDVVWVEQPTYFLVAKLFQCHGLIVHALPMSAPGVLDMEQLAANLLATSTPPRMIYLIPTHQNPTGRTLPVAARAKLAALAAQYEILIVADEVYHLLDWSTTNQRPARMVLFQEPPKAAATATDKNHVLAGIVSVSSLTKIFGPGVRLGWVEGSRTVVDALADYGYIKSQGGNAPLMGEIMRQALTTGVADDVLHRLCSEYQQRANILCDILQKDGRIHIPYVPQGGYFVWVEFPAAVKDVSTFLKYCGDEIHFMIGSRCNLVGDVSDELLTARLCFADMDESDLKEGTMLLLKKLSSFLRHPKVEGSDDTFLFMAYGISDPSEGIHRDRAAEDMSSSVAGNDNFFTLAYGI